MTTLKKIKPIIISVLIVTILLTGTVMARAEAKSAACNLQCGSYLAIGRLTTLTNRVASACTDTEKASIHFTYLYATVMGREVDKYGDTVKIVSGTPVEAKNTYTTGYSSISITSSPSTNYFKIITSTHIAKNGSYEKSGTAQITY